LVEVALVVVDLRPVKFCRVEDPVTSKLERVVRPEVTLSVPVRLAALDIVWPFSRPEVIAPAWMFPVLSEVEKRLVEDAMVAKKLVVVALVKVTLPVKAFVPLQVLLKALEPLQVLLSPSRVEEAELAPQPVQLPTTSVPMLAVLALRSVVEARPET
jgi:hypothetical protein